MTSSDDPNTEAAVEKLLTNFNDNPLIARAVWDTGRFYRKSKKYDKAIQIHQYNVEHFPADIHAIWSQVEIIYSHLREGDDAGADAAVGNLLTVFSNQPTLPKEIYQVAGRYDELKKYDKARQLYQYNVEHFRKAIAISERIITELPESSFTPQAYILLGECYRRLGQQQEAMDCYQKVVSDWPDCEYTWYAYLLIGCTYEQLRDSGAVEKSVANAQITTAYERIVLKYPDCPAAGAARRWLNYYLKSSQGGQK